MSKFRMSIGALLLLAGPVVAGPAKETRDRHGGPLPPGALSRFGTVKLRALCDTLNFSSDGKSLIGVNGGHLVRVWSSATGELLETRRLPGEGEHKGPPHSFRSADGNTLLLCKDAALELWDVPSAKRLALLLPRGRKRIVSIALSDDRRLLFLAETVKEMRLLPPPSHSELRQQEQSLLLWDTKTAKLRVVASDECYLYALAISPDGKRLASSSIAKGTRLWDAASGKPLRQERGLTFNQVTFTSDSKHLICAGSGRPDRWHIWDATTGQQAKALQPPTVGYVQTFALSPDGSKLIAPTYTDYVLWDLKLGKVLHRWPGANLRAKAAFSPDGRSVVTHLTTLQRWDVTTGKPLFADVSALGHTAAVRHLFFTPDGKRLISAGEDGAIRLLPDGGHFNSAGQDVSIRIWDVASTRLLHTIAPGPVPITAWALTPDGSTLVGVDNLLTVRQWAVASGRSGTSHELRAVKERVNGLQVEHVRVAPDGKTLVVAGWYSTLELPRCRLPLFSFWGLQTGRLQHWGDRVLPYQFCSPSLAPDGRLTAFQGNLYDTLSGQCRLFFSQKEGDGFPWSSVFSPDGRLLAGNWKGVRFWEAATGQRIIDLPEMSLEQAAFSPTGRLFACADARRLVVYDLSTAKAVLERTGEELRALDSWVTSMAFAPDGRALATGHADGTILLWGLPPGAARNLTDAAALWEDLAGPAVRGQAAVWRMQDDPQAAVRFLRKQVVVVPALKAAELKRSIGELDSERFETREAAARRLAALGRAAEPALREAIEARPPLEQSRRIEALLKALPQVLPPQGDDLRAVRAVAILEGCNTVEARELLRVWARGMPGAWLTEEARAALARLGRR